MGKEIKKKKKGKRARLGLGSIVILLICAIVFCGSAAYLGLYAKENTTAEGDFEKLASAGSGLAKLESAYAKNDETIGWIHIKDTKINYPVMQTPSAPEFYLHKNFKKVYSESGVPFMDAASKVGDGEGSYAVAAKANETANKSTWNWLLHGHNMKFGTMFHDITKFEDKDFRDSHTKFRFDTIVNGVAEKGTYELVAVARSKIYPKDSKKFKYYNYAGFYSEDSFNEFVEGIRSESMYDYSAAASGESEIKYGDQLLTLSTCAYHTKNGRFYIVARKVK